MAKKHKHPEHVNHERWLVSYADFITLLFAFFVVMFAVSQVDSNKVGRFSDSFKEAMDIAVFESKGAGLLPGERPPPGPPGKGKGAGNKGGFVEQKQAIKNVLGQKASGKSGTLEGLNILEARGELVLRLPERLMFQSGDATLQPGGKEALRVIMDEVAPRPVRVRVEGHTDNVAIRTARYPSNWELSTARATAVVAFLIESSAIEPARLAAAGYGEYHPVAGNSNVEGRQQNRRVDLIIVSDFQEETAP